MWEDSLPCRLPQILSLNKYHLLGDSGYYKATEIGPVVTPFTARHLASATSDSHLRDMKRYNKDVSHNRVSAFCL
jgi:hypothetical protein